MAKKAPRAADTYRGARRNLWRTIVSSASGAKWSMWPSFNQSLKQQKNG
jgi:hypothetical protein